MMALASLGALGPALVEALGQLLGAGMDQSAQDTASWEKRSGQARQAAQMEPFLQQLTNFNTNGLRVAANNVIGSQGRTLDASLAQRGIFNSGAAMQQHTALDSSVLSQLAQNINQDQYARLLAVAKLISSTPGFQSYDPNNPNAGPGARPLPGTSPLFGAPTLADMFARFAPGHSQ